MNGTLIVIAKECLPGRAKTRLHPPLTLVEAATVAQASLDMTLRTAVEVTGVERILFFDGDTASLRAAHPRLLQNFIVVAQPEGSLDERLGYIFDHVAQRHGAHWRTCLIGMDTPQVEATDINRVFEDSAAIDAWLGPTLDGGYWIIGLQQPTGAAIRGVPMSTDETYTAQMTRLLQLRYQVRKLPTVRDMDHWEDARAIGDLLPASAFAHTVNALQPPLSSTP